MNTITPSLKQRFFTQLASYPSAAQSAEAYWQELQKHYTESNRHYHNLAHLQALFASFDQCRHELSEPNIVAWAIWYHDIIYNAKRNDNEEKSAVLAADRLSEIGLTERQRARVLIYIRATAKHLSVDADPTSDLAYFLDFDLAVLAWPSEQYQQYAAAIRQEYRHVPGFLYRRGRRKVLRYFLDAPILFRTARFKIEHTEKARLNLQWELEHL